jgi:hypothetical protein
MPPLPEWLNAELGTEPEISVPHLAVRLLAAWMLGSVVGWLYRRSGRGGSPEAAAFGTTLVLLSMLIALVTQVVGDHVARAFSLVGALSIVRFRTAVQDTRDTAFVIFSVIVGMAAGAGSLVAAGIGLVLVGMAVLVAARWPRSAPAVVALTPLYEHVTVRIGLGPFPEASLGQVLREYVEDYQLVETATSLKGAALDLTYRARLKKSRTPAELVMQLNQVERVQGVELRAASER